MEEGIRGINHNGKNTIKIFKKKKLNLIYSSIVEYVLSMNYELKVF